MQAKKIVTYMLGCLFVVTIAAIGLCAYLLYMPFYFPKPTGQYAVGMREFYWIDTARKESRSTDPAHPYRELMVKAWYPTEVAAAAPQATPYAPAMMAFDRKGNKTIIQKIKFLCAGFDRPIYAYYVPQAPIGRSEKQFPVIIFSHGFGVPVAAYTAYRTELASHGYVVFSINHTYDCSFVDFPDGRRVLMSSDIEKMSDAESDVFWEKDINTWIADARFVLDQIEREANSKTSLFYRKLDLDHVGIAGHSYGGATAVQCCRLDKRFIVGCDMDGALHGADFAQAFAKPFMFIRGANACEESAPKIDSTLKPEERERAKICHKQNIEHYLLGIKRLATSIGCDTYLIDLSDAQHMSFTDIAILKHAGPFPRMHSYFGTGSVDGYAITHTINRFLVAFFDQYLKGIPNDILDPYRVAK